MKYCHCTRNFDIMNQLCMCHLWHPSHPFWQHTKKDTSWIVQVIISNHTLRTQTQGDSFQIYWENEVYCLTTEITGFSPFRFLLMGLFDNKVYWTCPNNVAENVIIINCKYFRNFSIFGEHFAIRSGVCVWIMDMIRDNKLNISAFYTGKRRKNISDCNLMVGDVSYHQPFDESRSLDETWWLESGWKMTVI